MSAPRHLTRFRVELDTGTEHAVTVGWTGVSWTPTVPRLTEGAMTAEGAARIAAKHLAGIERARVLVVERLTTGAE